MKELTQKLLREQLTFEQTYQRVKEVQPADPLESYGLSMQDFDALLDKHQTDPSVREAIGKIQSAANPNSASSEKAQSFSVKKIIDVHIFMLDQLQRINSDFQALPDKASYDMKTVTITAQAIVGSRIEQKFGITNEDLEGAILTHHAKLATDQEFATININIQHAMGQLMGVPLQRPPR